jgi:hypothetical protein
MKRFWILILLGLHLAGCAKGITIKFPESQPLSCDPAVFEYMKELKDRPPTYEEIIKLVTCIQTLRALYLE